MICISLGWGVQSFTLAVMSALGELPQVNAAIHADTTHERSDTYSFARKWTPWLEERGIEVITVRDKAPQVTTDRPGGKIIIPAFTATPSKSGGQLRRQCTQKWKVAPVRRWLQDHRDKQPVEMWLGISLDEAMRMKPSGVKYITNRWPLVEKRMSRHGCKLWLEGHGLEIPPKSACVFCPYHNQATWRELQINGNGDWQKAIEIDEAIRKVRPPYDLFIHPTRIPLDEVDLRTLQDKGQMELWNEECTGYCGL